MEIQKNQRPIRLTYAEKKWRKMKGVEDLKLLVAGAQFKDGIIKPLDEPQQALA